jgi:hypothetical protein
MRRRALTVLTAALLCASGIGAATADAKIPPQWKNCTVVNHRYPHGVGKYGARDKTSGTPVTNFKHSNALYALAMKWNRGLDRDHDGIACEKA